MRLLTRLKRATRWPWDENWTVKEDTIICPAVRMMEISCWERMKLLFTAKKFYVQDRNWIAICTDVHGKWVALKIRRVE